MTIVVAGVAATMPDASDGATGKPRIAISSCLLGNEVRYDGNHKRSQFLCSALAPFVEWVPVCPEVGIGLGVPRPALRLADDGGGTRLVERRSGEDHTERMLAWARAKARAFAKLDLDGVVLRSKSPNCGPSRVHVFLGERTTPRMGEGLFAGVVRKALPGVPISEDGWLHDPGLRDAFLAQVFTLHRLRRSLAEGAGGLLQFHGAHDLLYLAHCPSRRRTLCRLAKHTPAPWPVAAMTYRVAAMAALGVPSSPDKHAFVMERVLALVEPSLAEGDRQEILDAIADLRAGLHGVAAPRALLAHQLRHHGMSGWLAKQAYWEPYPRAIAAKASRSG